MFHRLPLCAGWTILFSISVLAGCGSGAGEEAVGDSSTRPVTESSVPVSRGSDVRVTSSFPGDSSTGTTVTTLSCPPLVKGVTHSRGRGNLEDVAVLADVTAVPLDPCIDRVRFRFAKVSHVPGYSVNVEPGPFVSEDGQPIEVSGEEFFVVRFETATTIDWSSGEAVPLYTRESLRPSDTRRIREVRLVEAFEGVVQFVVGVDPGSVFVVKETLSPPALILRVSGSSG